MEISGSTGVRWAHFAREAPELAGVVQDRFTRFPHHVLATLRRSGAPRVSGTEVGFVGEDLTFGSMGRARKLQDLLADGRLALHANPGDGTMEGGDAKVSGVAEALTGEAATAIVGDPQENDGAVAFRVLLTDVVRTTLHPDGDRLVVTVWRPGRGLQVIDRY